MKVLIVNGGSNGAQSMVASAVARQLRDAGDNVTLHCPRVDSGGRTRPVTYGDEEGDIEPSAHLLGVEEIIVVPYTGEWDGAEVWLDVATRSTYNLLKAAVQAGVNRVTILTSMASFLAYPANCVVATSWSPRPTTAPHSLAPHLAEFIGAQFAKATVGGMCVCVARIGTLEGGRFRTSVAKAAAEIIKELKQSAHDVPRWKVLHVHDTLASTHSNTPAVTSKLDGGFRDRSNAKHHVKGREHPARHRRVLVLGARGFLGPHLLDALSRPKTGYTYDVLATDIPGGQLGDEPEAVTDWRNVVLAKYGGDKKTVASLDITNAEAVAAAVRSVDVVVNCAVTRYHPCQTWRVNCYGTFYAVSAAQACGHSRFVNTGPMFAVVGPGYEDYDCRITEHVPPHPGLRIYAITKGVGHEITRVFAENHRQQLRVMNVIFNGFYNPEPSSERRFDGTGAPGGDTQVMAISWPDAGRLLRRCLEVPLSRLPRTCEVLFGHTTTPHGRYDNTYTRAVLGWEPIDALAGYWSRL